MSWWCLSICPACAGIGATAGKSTEFCPFRAHSLKGHADTHPGKKNYEIWEPCKKGGVGTLETHTEGTLTCLQRWGGFWGAVMFQRWPSQLVKNLPANAGDVGRSLSQEDPLEKKMATHSSILAWEIPWTEEPGRLQSMGLKKSDMTESKQPLCLLWTLKDAESLDSLGVAGRWQSRNTRLSRAPQDLVCNSSSST